MDNCPVCFKEQKGYKLLKGDLAFACLQYEIERLRTVNAKAPPAAENPKAEEEVAELDLVRRENSRLTEEIAASERKRAKARLRVRELEGEVERLRREVSMKKSPVVSGGTPMDLSLLRKMLLLCHPDTNPSNVALATEATQWLLTYKQAHHGK